MLYGTKLWPDVSRELFPKGYCLQNGSVKTDVSVQICFGYCKKMIIQTQTRSETLLRNKERALIMWIVVQILKSRPQKGAGNNTDTTRWEKSKRLMKIQKLNKVRIRMKVGGREHEEQTNRLKALKKKNRIRKQRTQDWCRETDKLTKITGGRQSSIQGTY